MYEIQQTEKVIICPWCFSAIIDKHDEEEAIICSICKREITQEDLRDADNQND